MFRKSLVKGIAICLAASSISGVTLPVMAAETAPDVVKVAEIAESEVEQETDVQSTDQEDTDEQPSESTDQQDEDESAGVSVSPASLITNDNGKPAWVEGADKNHPVYTSEVSVANGTIAEDISKDNAGDYITFTGVFENSAIQDFRVNEDRTGFTVVFTKECFKQETNFEGGMIVKGSTVQLADETTSPTDLSLYMYDTYRVSESSDSKAIIDADAIEKLIREEGNTAVKAAMNALFKLALPKAFAETLVNWIMNQGVNFNKTDAPAEPSKELKAITALSDQLSQSTLEILNGIEKNSLQNAASTVNAAIGEMDTQYSQCNYTLEQVKNWTDAGTLEANQGNVENYMTSIYRFGNGNANITSKEGANFTYYNTLIKLGKAITGENTLFSTYNVFQINHGISSCLYNYNTQTFEGRREFNKSVIEYYDRGYAALTTAINYDIQKNIADKAAYEDEKNALLQQTADKSLTGEAQEKLNAAISTLTTKITNAGNAITQGNLKLSEMEKQRNEILTLKQESDDEINSESEQPYVLCYRNNVRYEKALTVTEAVPENFGSDTRIFTKAGAWEFFNTEENWKYRSYFERWDGTEDKDCGIVDLRDGTSTPTSVATSSAVYKGNQYSDMNYLAEIAKKRGVTLEEDLKTAFSYDGDASEVSGYYNGGRFTVDKENHPYAGHFYYGEELRGQWPFTFTWATYYDYHWYSVNHVTDYYTPSGKQESSTLTRSFALSDGYCTTEGSDNFCNEYKLTGDNIKLFVVNLYED